MTISPQAKFVASLLAGSLLLIGQSAIAVSPASVLQGRQLFERNWPAGNPALGGDGLGPLFNGQSCVACHHQGGIGGGGDSRFNAKSIGIETMKITGGPVNDDVVARMIGAFHPGFVSSPGVISNTLPLSHHGGSPAFEQARANLMSQVPAEFSELGGPLDAEETRRSFATPIFFERKIGMYVVSLQARLFHRNTTPLFGSGLIDQVAQQEIDAQVRLQERHPEISGRPSVLKDGRYGKFGWRANIASLLDFNDQACANEVGLETKRKPQPRDPMIPGYRNPTIDISDQQVRTLTEFVAALPAPVREIPSDSEERMQAEYGERVFASVGCAICHVPNMQPAAGIYSDLLLHDMGYESFDLNHAEPYRVRMTPVRIVESITSTTTNTNATSSTGYYGGDTSMTTSKTQTTRPSGSTADRFPRARASHDYRFVAPSQPETMKVIDLGTETEELKDSVAVSERDYTYRFASGRQQSGTTKSTQRTSGTQEVRRLIRVHYEPTNFNQEWRTPPLWGLRDSAPYMHDGRAETVLEAISMHDGEAAGTRDRFLLLPLADRYAILAFLDTLVAPPNVPQPAL